MIRPGCFYTSQPFGRYFLHARYNRIFRFLQCPLNFRDRCAYIGKDGGLQKNVVYAAHCLILDVERENLFLIRSIGIQFLFQCFFCMEDCCMDQAERSENERGQISFVAVGFSVREELVIAVPLFLDYDRKL